VGADRDSEIVARALERVTRVEERIDQFKEQITRVELAITDQTREIKDFVAVTVNGRFKELDGKYALVRGIVLGACAMILTAFFAAVVASFIGAQMTKPTLPQPYSIQPRSLR
jgi:hypothetical protein